MGCKELLGTMTHLRLKFFPPDFNSRFLPKPFWFYFVPFIFSFLFSFLVFFHPQTFPGVARGRVATPGFHGGRVPPPLVFAHTTEGCTCTAAHTVRGPLLHSPRRRDPPSGFPVPVRASQFLPWPLGGWSPYLDQLRLRTWLIPPPTPLKESKTNIKNKTKNQNTIPKKEDSKRIRKKVPNKSPNKIT